MAVKWSGDAEEKLKMKVFDRADMQLGTGLFFV